jgi:hypothetical protein
MPRHLVCLSFWVCAATLPLGAATAAAEPPGTSTIILQTAPPKDPNVTDEAAKTNYEKRQVCQPQQVIGSRIPRTVCATQSQMDARRKADQAWKQSLDLTRDRQAPPGGGVVGG